MQKHLKRLSALLAGALLLLTTVPAALVGAQETGSGSGLRISPVRTDLTINPGSSGSATITVKNVTSAEITYEALVNDFIAGDNELGQPALILDADKFAPSHSLKRYVEDIPALTVPSGESRDVKVNIIVPKDAAAGGYYGAVRFVPAGNTDNQRNITLAASVGSLILVSVPGDIKENVKLESFDVRTSETAESASVVFFSNKNLYAVARFNNSGNIHEQPFGKVQLKRGDTVLQTTEINNTDPRGNVLPDSIRRFSIKLDKVGSWGKYTVEGNFGYGSNGQLLSGTSTFYVIPLTLIIGAIVLIALIIAAILWVPKAIKRYNQNVVRKASRK